MAFRNKILRLSIGLVWLVESFLLIGSAQAQESSSKILKSTRISELGIGIGGLNYQGDIATNYRFKNNRPAATLFYRKVVSQPVTFRAALTGGFFRAADEDFRDNPFQAYRNAEISSRLIELGIAIEYYFFDYYDFNRVNRWSPYFFAAPNIFYYSTDRKSGPANYQEDSGTDSGMRLSLAMGAGVKFAINRYWNIGAEFGPRLVVSRDYLDDMTELSAQERMLSNPNDRDWYIYNGVFVSYTFYKTFCPSVYKRNHSIIFD